MVVVVVVVAVVMAVAVAVVWPLSKSLKSHGFSESFCARFDREIRYFCGRAGNHGLYIFVSIYRQLYLSTYLLFTNMYVYHIFLL